MYNKEQTHTICTRALRNTYNRCTWTKKHTPYTWTHIEHAHCYREQQTHIHASTHLPNITSPVRGYCILTMQPYHCEVCYPTKYIRLTVCSPFQGNDEYAWACRWKKTHGRQSLALPDTVHSQEMVRATLLQY